MRGGDGDHAALPAGNVEAGQNGHSAAPPPFRNQLIEEQLVRRKALALLEQRHRLVLVHEPVMADGQAHDARVVNWIAARHGGAV